MHAAQAISRVAQPQSQRAHFVPGAGMRGGGIQSSPIPARYSLRSSPPIRAYRQMMQRRASRSGRESVRRDSPSRARRQTAHPVENLFTSLAIERHQPLPAMLPVAGSYREPDRSAHRRPPIPARVASRRVSAQQLNQENSGDAEAELMREEMVAAGMRFAEGAAGLDVMDETPPRVGRFERLMMEN